MITNLTYSIVSLQVSGGSGLRFTKKNMTNKPKITKPRIPFETGKLTEWTLKKYGGLTSFNSLTEGNVVTLHVGIGRCKCRIVHKVKQNSMLIIIIQDIGLKLLLLFFAGIYVLSFGANWLQIKSYLLRYYSPAPNRVSLSKCIKSPGSLLA